MKSRLLESLLEKSFSDGVKAFEPLELLKNSYKHILYDMSHSAVLWLTDVNFKEQWSFYGTDK